MAEGLGQWHECCELKAAHLLIQLAAQGGHAIELDGANEVVRGGRVTDAVALLRAVHETDEDAVIIEHRGHFRHAAQNQLQVVDSLPTLLKRHRACNNAALVERDRFNNMS